MAKKLLKEDYLKTAKCHIEVETMHSEKYSMHQTVLEKVMDIHTTVDFSDDPCSPIKHGSKWQHQIFTAVMNELQSLPHIGIPENDFWFDFCKDDDGKTDLYMKSKINRPKGERSFSFYGIVAQIRFSDRKYVGDPKKAFVI